MLTKTIINAAAALMALTSSVFAYDLKTVELVPVKFQKAPAHTSVKLVENGKIKFAIVTDLNSEKYCSGDPDTAGSLPAVYRNETSGHRCQKC